MGYILLAARRRIGKIPVPLLVVAVVLVGLVATVLQAIPRSQAEATTVDNIRITPLAPEAEIKTGTDDVCVISRRTNFAGDETKVVQFIDAVSRSARDNGATVVEGGANPAPGVASYDLTISYEFPLSQWSISPALCAIDKITESIRGRSTLEIPPWARGILAAAANVTVYMAITFGVMAIFSFLAPEFEVYGLMLSGCLGGFASNVVSNLINQVPLVTSMSYAAMQCVSGAIQNVTVGKTVTAMMNALRKYLGTASSIAGQAVVDNLAIGESMRSALSESLRREFAELADQLPT